MPEEVRVLVADDHPLFRQELRQLLDAAAGIRVVGEAADGEEALAGVRATTPDIAILDLDMPRADGLDVARDIQAMDLPVRVVFLTAHRSNALVTRALRAGVRGYVLKDNWVTEILACVREVNAGRQYVRV